MTTFGRKSQWRDFAHTVDVLTAMALAQDDLAQNPVPASTATPEIWRNFAHTVDVIAATALARDDLGASAIRPSAGVVSEKDDLPIRRSRFVFRRALGWIEGRGAFRGYLAHRSRRALASIRLVFPSPIAIATLANVVILIATTAMYYRMSPTIEPAKEQGSAPELTTLNFYGWSNNDITTARNDEEVMPSRDRDWTFEVSASGLISGTIKGTDDDGQALTWEVTGLVRGDEIAVALGSGGRNKHSATSVVRVTKQPDSETYLGLILGKNCKTAQTLVCPYMFTKGQQGDDLRWSQRFGNKKTCDIQMIPPPELVCG